VLVVDKDLRSELRARSFLQAALSFAATAVLVFSFALGPERAQLRLVAPGLLWVAASFAAVFALGRSFAAERDAGTLEGLLLFPVPREALFLGKTLANLAMLLPLTAAALLLMFLLYGLPAPVSPLPLIAVLVLGSAGLSTAGTFYGALSAQLSVREAFLPILVLPVVVPLIVTASRATAAALTGIGPGVPWVSLLAAFDAVLLAATAALFRHVVES
jgi:heme exporter protein B